MSLEEYKLSCVLYGHSLDVRSVDVDSEDSILSGSRDKTCKFWRSCGMNAGYYENITYKGHKNYISSVCCMKPSAEFPSGLIISGGNDSIICVYTLLDPEPVITLKGHSNTVCNITNGIKPNQILTSSWDCTAKLWLISNVLNEVTVFTGHQAAVWAAVQLPNGNVVTGSADKDIFIWAENGAKMKTLKGHTDCVRGLAILNDNMFASVANDASIKQWTLEGDCLDTIYGHGNYIYSISANRASGDDCFVTSGEDRVVKFWKGGKNTQTITLPAQSVWSVACMTNGDIVTGSSDGLVRVFTQNADRVADEQQLKLFEEEVASLTVASSQEIGGVKISDLPGKEVLYEPGKSDGQTKLIREGASVMCYSWSAAEGTWNKVGDVMGAAGGTQASSGKTLHEGKEYDFVFSVDIEDGKPPIKLPYNRDQDPWAAAQEFIHKNDLSQMFLDQVANFIVQNSGAAVLQQTSQTSDYIDPFTGGSRYLPGSDTRTGPGNAGQNLDPFTGGSSYTTSTTNTNIAPVATPANALTGNAPSLNIQQKPAVISSYFPHLRYLFFDQGNVSLIHEKLKEFNKKTGDNISSIDENLLDGVVKLANGSESDAMSALLQLLHWPFDIVFPVLDITRLAMRHQENNSVLCSQKNGEILVQLLRKYLVENVAANKMLALRIMCNMFSYSSGETLMLSHENLFLNDISTLGNNLNKNSQIALSTFLLNLSIALIKAQNVQRQSVLLETIARTILNLNDLEAEFRGYVALGTILSNLRNTPRAQNSSFLPQLKEKMTAIAGENAIDPTKQRNIACAKQLNILL